MNATSFFMHDGYTVGAGHARDIKATIYKLRAIIAGMARSYNLLFQKDKEKHPRYAE